MQEKQFYDNARRSPMQEGPQMRAGFGVLLRSEAPSATIEIVKLSSRLPEQNTLSKVVLLHVFRINTFHTTQYYMMARYVGWAFDQKSFFFFLTAPPKYIFLGRSWIIIPKTARNSTQLTRSRWSVCLWSLQLPPALFDTNALPRPAGKLRLADQLWVLTQGVNNSQPPELSSCILDGGALPRRVPWQRGKTYDALCAAHVTYVDRWYGQNITVVFDGYETHAS